MAVKHNEFNIYGLQFHPESILTPDGLTIIENFLQKVKRGIL
jgi:anthranilate synthase component 2